MRAALLVYRLIVAAHPQRFRRRFGSAMEQSFCDGYTGAARGGTAAAAWFVARACADAALNAVALRGLAIRDAIFWPDPLGSHERKGTSDMWWQILANDARYAFRMFRRDPMFAALAVVALGLGIGANTAIFTLVDGVLLRPLPYADQDRLVMIWSSNEREHREHDVVSPLDFMDFKRASAFTSVEAAYSFVIAGTWTSSAAAEPITLTAVTPALFRTLGRAPARGRLFTDDDLQTGVLISYDFWQKRLGGDPAVVGRVLNIAYQPATIVGVMPKDFVFPYRAMLGPSGFSRSLAVDVWVPLSFVDANAFNRSTGTAPLARGVRMLSVVARLRDGVTPEQARAEVQGIARQLATAQPDTNRGIGADVVPVHEQAVGAARPALLLLLGGVGLVLLMACVNLANMLLARSTSRQKELAIRAALGAGRGRLMSQTFVESVLLGCMGGLLALLFLRSSLQAILALAPPELPRVGEVHANGTVLVFTAVLSIATGILIGFVPAVASSRADVNSGLKQSSRSATSGRAQRRIRGSLVVIEAALAVVLTVGAALLVRSFVSLLAVDPGFQVDRLLTMQLALPPKYNAVEPRRVMYAELKSRLENLPGVTGVGGTTRLPLGSTNVTSKIVVDGRSVAPSQWPEAEFRRSIFDYFSTMGIPVLRGRAFTAQDGPSAPPVCIINETMARQIFPGEDPLGKRIKFGTTDGPWSTIVGVIGDIRHSALDRTPEPEVYVNYLSNPPVNPFIVIRTGGDPLALVAAVRAQLAAVDKDIASNDIRPMSEVLSNSVAERRFILLLASAFGVLALAMAAVGVYGVMALVVSERTAEMAIRLALGAEPSRVLAQVLRQGLALAVVGVAAGLAASAVMAPSLRSLLYGVRPVDPVTFGAVPALVIAVAMLACLGPAWRGMRVNPVTALRME
ncbi:MAG TPA: ABC transporter permease [Vicinamibacterales bacterium]|nr:ABC transporter permease [Vicinamibacterales bacterium]